MRVRDAAASKAMLFALEDTIKYESPAARVPESSLVFVRVPPLELIRTTQFGRLLAIEAPFVISSHLLYDEPSPYTLMNSPGPDVGDGSGTAVGTGIGMAVGAGICRPSRRRGAAWCRIGRRRARHRAPLGRQGARQRIRIKSQVAEARHRAPLGRQGARQRIRIKPQVAEARHRAPLGRQGARQIVQGRKAEGPRGSSACSIQSEVCRSNNCNQSLET